MMRMEHRQTQTQTQQLVLTQKMQQALQILQLSSLELEQYVQQELETNPFLDQVAKKEEPAQESATSANDAKTSDTEPAYDESFDLDDYRDSWDIRRREGTDLSYNPDMHAKRKFFEDSITQDESLRAHLLTQMRLVTEDDQDYAIGERIIIGDIDDRGYFTGDTAAIAEELDVPEERVLHVLGLIRGFEPTGVGAKDMAECLLLQIDAEYPDEEELRLLVKEHLEELKHRQLPQIAKVMKTTAEHVEELRKMLAALNPWPGHVYSAPPAHYVTPDVVVEKIDGEFAVRLIDERIPTVCVNKEYSRTVKKGSLSKDDKEYVRAKLESANWLERNIAQRQQTVLRVSQAIVEIQQAFFESGVEHIRPLTLQDIADIVGVHESTVARTTRGKYMQTPQGLFEMKYFFSPGLSRDHGDDPSSTSVQAMVRKIIDGEDKRKPLSDQKVADLLKKDGINIARRTVTKYREGMGILKTTMRKAY